MKACFHVWVRNWKRFDHFLSFIYQLFIFIFQVMKAIRIPCDRNLELSMQVTRIIKEEALQWQIIKPALHFIKARVMRCRLLELLNQIIKQWCSNNRNQQSTHVPELLLHICKIALVDRIMRALQLAAKAQRLECSMNCQYECSMFQLCVWGKIRLYQGLQSIRAVNSFLLRLQNYHANMSKNSLWWVNGVVRLIRNCKIKL